MAEQHEPLLESISPVRELKDKKVEIRGVPTGVPGLDEMFFTTTLENGRPVIHPLGGYPERAVIHLTGVSDTGKSLMAEQFVIQQAALGNPTAFVTVESPAPFIVTGLQQRASQMGINFSDIEDQIIIIDAATYSSLRDNLPVLFDTLAHAIKTYHIKNTVIDSITGLYEAKEMMARQIVRPLFNFLKKWHQTALFVSQKRSGHEELTAEAAGGFAISHIVDCTIVVAKHLIASQYDARIYKRPLGEIVRLIRIDGCRMCGHDSDTHFMEITPGGIVKIGPKLKAVLGK
ncbi:MAG: KaiC domain-containing protein [Calditrichaeota bacterium]|nr:KaiC domain-containing protein [Calditrichota bacterium]